MAEIRALLHIVTLQLVSSTVEFPFRYNGSSRRSICVFGACIPIILAKFFGGSILSKERNLSNIFKILIESVQLCTM